MYIYILIIFILFIICFSFIEKRHIKEHMTSSTGHHPILNPLSPSETNPIPAAAAAVSDPASTDSFMETYGYPQYSSDDSTAYISMIADDELVIYYDKTGNKDPLNIHNTGQYVGRINKPYKIYRFKILDMLPESKLYFFNRNKGTTSPHCYFSGHIHYNGITYSTNNDLFKIVGIENNL